MKIFIQQALTAIHYRATESIKGLTWKTAALRAYLPVKWRLLNAHKTTFIGITGSAGKTTTKDAVAHILTSFDDCHKTDVTYNDPIGVASTIRQITKKTRYCVLEMSVSAPDSMSRCLKFVQPKIAVVTNIGHDHYGAFKSLEGIAEEKGKLVRGLPTHGVAVLNIDDPHVRAMANHTNARIIGIGQAKGATLRLLDVRSKWPEPLIVTLEYENKVFEVKTQLHGTHFAFSVASALAVAIALGIPLEKAIKALADMQPSEARMQLVTDKEGITFIRDDWKAPEWALPQPLEFLKSANASRKIAIIGSISDSSKGPTKRYTRAARLALKSADKVIFVGRDAEKALKARSSKDDDRILAFADVTDVAHWMNSELRSGDLVLLKGNHTANHLGRLALNRIKPIGCWRVETECDSRILCSRCPKLYEPFNTLKPYLDEQSDHDIPLIIGLGNPGEEFVNTPHNAGYTLVDMIAEMTKSKWNESHDGLICNAEFEGKKFQMLKPAAVINHSGKLVRHFLETTNSNLSQCLVIHDDMDLPIGKVRQTVQSGDGGHRGVRSLIEALGTTEIHRLKIGVRDPEQKGSAKTLVLSQLGISQKTPLSEGMNEAILLVKKFIVDCGKSGN